MVDDLKKDLAKSWHFGTKKAVKNICKINNIKEILIIKLIK